MFFICRWREALVSCTTVEHCLDVSPEVAKVGMIQQIRVLNLTTEDHIKQLLNYKILILIKSRLFHCIPISGYPR